jgi:hypothetical protein
MEDVASRIDSRIQITTDGHRAYAEAVEGVFGMDVDYAMLIKLYGSDSFDTKYSPGEWTSRNPSPAPETRNSPDPAIPDGLCHQQRNIRARESSRSRSSA